MDIRIEVGEKEKGSIPYESLPAFYYLFRELGYEVQMDLENHKVQLNSILHGKRIFLSPDHDVEFHTLRKNDLEWKVLEYIQTFLAACGANVTLNEKTEGTGNADFYFNLSLFEISVIKEPVLELFHHPKSSNKNVLDIFQYECKRIGTKFKSNTVMTNGNSPFMKVHIMYPISSNEDFFGNLAEKYAMAITTGILARFHENSPLSVLSLVPIEMLSTLFFPNENTAQSLIPAKQIDQSLAKKKKKLVKRPNESQRTEAEVFLDYHTFIDEQEDGEKIKFIGNLHIKNIGTEILRNPVICLRSTPSDSIKISGQILPPNVAKTMGVMNDEGTKGWKYMNDDWLEEAENGETWITPINPINIHPRQTESLSNFQISVHPSKVSSNILVEAFVFFKEQGLEVPSINRISIVLTKKQPLT